MRYSYKLISRYIDGPVDRKDLIGYFEMLGLNPVITEDAKEDIIFELETPANRGDLLSLTGVAREIMPFIAHSLKMPESGFKETLSEKLPVRIENENDCFYYSCRLIKNISTAGHPGWLRESIEKLGYRSSLNVVDISNFVMAEIGQPLHMFDLDKIEGGVEVRRARKGEILITIDGRKRDLDESVLVIADSRKVVALAGIMGGENSEVTQGTKNILIESAVFNPVIVRRGSRKLGLATESSARFERGIDRDCSEEGMVRATFLTREICKGEIGSLSEEGGRDEESPCIDLDMARVNSLSGIKVEGKFIKKTLNKLNFEVKKKGASYVVKPPVYRKDIRDDVDVIEEIVKYRQYSEIPSSIPVSSITPTPSSAEVETMEHIRDVAVRLGFTEVVNLGITSRGNADISGADSPVEIENPLSASLGFLRTSLIPEMMEVAVFNINHEVKSFDIFELGKVFYRKEGSFGEECRLSFLSVNSGDFFVMKGNIEKLLEKSGIRNMDYRVQPGIFSPGANLGIYCSGIEIGNLFVPSEEIKNIYNLKTENVYACELYIEKLMDKISFGGIFREPAKFPSSTRDFSFIFPEDIAWKDIEDVIFSLNLPVEKIEFFDSYRGDNIPEQSISVAFSVIFRSQSKTLESEEVSEFSQRIIDGIYSNLKGKLRGGSGDS